jgi:hypothetical protein
MERRPRNLVLGIVATVGTLVAVVGGLLHSWSSALSDASMCANGIVREETSPERRWRVVIFERDCGATVRESTQMSIAPADALEARVLPTLGDHERVLLDGARTSEPDDFVFHKTEQFKNYSTSRAVLERFITYCRTCSGFEVL